MKYRIAIPTILVPLAALLMLAPATTADPYTATDRQFLAALHHGGLCCPQQADTPIPIGNPDDAIVAGKTLAALMAKTPTYAAFQTLRSNMMKNTNSGLNSFDAGESIVISVHYYASPAVECALMKQMGGAMGEAPYWYGTVTYSGGLTVQPGCIDLSR